MEGADVEAGPKLAQLAYFNSYCSLITSASFAQGKNRLIALNQGPKSGSPVQIVNRGRPVARLAPVDRAQMNDNDRLARLIREGIGRPGRGQLPKSFLSEPLPRAKDGASVLEALLGEWREDR